MVRKTRKQKGGDLADNGSGYRIGTITINGKEYNIQRKANLKKAQLQGADLSGADLYKANLQGADLTGADLFMADLGDAVLEDAILNRAELTSAYLNRANFKKAVLKDAVLERAKLEGAILTGANLNEANLDSANLKGAYLNRANLKKAVLQYANLTSADLTDVDLTDAKYNINTKWPEGFTIPETAVLVQEPESESESEQYKIILTENMTKSNSQNSCNDKLYKKIMDLTTDQIETSIFKFDGQSGIDVGGLTRIVHDLFLKSFINNFFLVLGDDTKILKDKLDEVELDEATNKLIVLTEKTKKVWGHHGEETTGSINIIPIEENLLKILLTKNVEDYIKQNKNKNKYHKRTYSDKTYNLLNEVTRNTNSIPLINATNATNVTNETIKNYLIAFLTINGFDSYKQYLNMRKWIQTYWNPEIFSNHLSFDFETFSERVLLKFGNSSEDKLSEFKNSNVASYSSYKLLPLFLGYLSSDNNEYRKNFTMLVSGSSTYGGILRIIFEEQANPDALYNAHTCSCEINIYNNEVGMSINDLNGAIEGEIKHIRIQD